MAVITRSNTTVEDHGVLESRSAEVGEWNIGFATFRADLDHAPILKGLPDDRCQCPHLGYVVKGRMSVAYADRTEVAEAGDAFYMTPGHVPTIEAGSEVLMFSLISELKPTEEAIQRNFIARQQQAQHA
jgi:hypothetical protein